MIHGTSRWCALTFSANFQLSTDLQFSSNFFNKIYRTYTSKFWFHLNDFYCPQTNLLEGNVFTPVCPGGCMMSLPVWSHILSKEYDVTSFLVLSGPMFLPRGSGPKGSGPRGVIYPLILTSSGGHQSGWCASYWLAFLLWIFL